MEEVKLTGSKNKYVFGLEYITECRYIINRKANEVISLLRKDGWILKAQKGSHAHYVHPVKSGKVTLPMRRGDLAKGTLRSIFRQADWPWPP